MVAALPLLFLLSCRFHHAGSKGIPNNEEKPAVVVKKIANTNDFVPWPYSPGNHFFVKKVWDSSREEGCRHCHEGHLPSEMFGEIRPGAHWHIQMEHAPGHLMNCQTCHVKDQVWLFHAGQEQVDANNAPRMCLGCHFEQERDWELGAHGKRVTGWQYERGIHSCVDCHNPHRPGLKKSWPGINPHRFIDDEERL